MPLKPLKIIIRGAHDTGRTTVASFIKHALESNGFQDVRVLDMEPLPEDQKPSWWNRFQRNQCRPIRITVELEL